MSDDEDQYRADRKQSRSISSDGKIKVHRRRKRSAREARHDSAVEFVNRLEQALRNLFGEKPQEINQPPMQNLPAE